VAAASGASATAVSAIVGAVDYRKSDEDDPEALIVKKITDAVHISHYSYPQARILSLSYTGSAGEHFRCSVIII